MIMAVCVLHLKDDLHVGVESFRALGLEVVGDGEVDPVASGGEWKIFIDQVFDSTVVVGSAASHLCPALIFPEL